MRVGYTSDRERSAAAKDMFCVSTNQIAVRSCSAAVSGSEIDAWNAGRPTFVAMDRSQECAHAVGALSITRPPLATVPVGEALMVNKRSQRGLGGRVQAWVVNKPEADPFLQQAFYESSDYKASNREATLITSS